MTRQPLTMWMTVAAAGLLAAGPVWAQRQASQGGGRALDANQQVGSGGVNQPAQVIDYAARNALITGNAPGGREFRGNVGYSAPTEFRGSVGSDDLFSFNAGSLGSSLPVVQSGIRYNLGSEQVVVVPRSTGSPDYYSSSELLVANRIVAPSGGTYTAGQIAAGTARITLPEPGTVTVAPGSDGRLLEVSTSTLLGLREVPRVVTLPQDREADESQRSMLRLDTSIAPERQLTPEGMLPMPTQPLDQQQRERDLPLTTQVDPGLTLGQQINATRLGTDRRTFDQQVADIEKAMFRQLGSRVAAPGEDVYLDVLRAMRGEAAAPKASDAPKKDLPELDAPTIEELEQAEQERRKALEAAAAAKYLQQQQPERTPRPGVTGVPAVKPEDGDGEESESLDGLLSTLTNATELPRLTTLAGERESRVNTLMRDAEADLAAERYFDAEAKYRQVLTDAPNTPLAMAGQVHAQLSAAMLKSAAYNLRTLFERHPELIGVRYDARLLPPQKRMDYIHGQIMEELRESPRPETATLLAYLGYQIDSRQLVRYGLAVAEKRSPQDPLLPLLRRIWLNERDDAAGPSTDVPPRKDADPTDPAAAPAPGGDASPGK